MQDKVDAAEPLISVLYEFNGWLQARGLLDKQIGFVTDGPCDFYGTPIVRSVDSRRTPGVKAAKSIARELIADFLIPQCEFLGFPLLDAYHPSPTNLRTAPRVACLCAWPALLSAG